MRRFLFIIIALLIVTSPIWAATYTVTNSADSGAGSLRQAALDAVLAGGGLIAFDITTEVGYATPEGSGWVTDEASGAEWFRIILYSGPISINNNITIEGSSQPTDEVNNPFGPEIEIRNPGAIAVYFNGNNSKIDHLVLNGSFTGVYIGSGNNNNTVTGCYIGTTASGESSNANATGVIISGDNNIIGGSSAAERNVISGNSQFGINITGISNEVRGNYIGTDISGTTAIQNSNGGIYISSNGNKIGDGTGGGRNVISGNFRGIVLSGSNATSNEVLGNYIGTDVNGTADLGNNQHGIYISSNANMNIIGDGTVGGRNIIAGHSGADNAGVKLDTSSGNTIEGNWVGLGADESIKANYYGIEIMNSSQSNYIISNVVSGNSYYGIYMHGTGTNSNEIVGNYIGTDSTGTIDKGNSRHGILLAAPAQFNKIGDGTVGGRNIISGNDWSGVYFGGVQTYYNEVLGNFIGTQADGSTALPNGQNGVVLYIGSKENKIGDGTTGGRNIMSGNTGNGILIYGSGTNSNEVMGNFIGVQADGTSPLANGSGGILIDSSAQYNRIGSSETSDQKNIVAGHSGTGKYGIEINASTNNYVEGNWIGLATDESIATNESGIIITNNAQSNSIISNVISGNSYGIIVTGEGTGSNEVLGNYIGTDLTGTTDKGNTIYGIYLLGGTDNNKIGNGTAGGRNIISGNDTQGIFISGTGTDHNEIIGNYIGTDVNGTSGIKNNAGGIVVSGAAKYNKIGDGSVGGKNIIASDNTNSGAGIWISGSGTNSNEVYGNYVGVGTDGSTDLGFGTGIRIQNQAQFNMIGNGTAGGRNLVSGNDDRAFWITMTGTSYNRVYGNYIGTQADGVTPLANLVDGILLNNGSSDNYIGSNESGKGNIISGNAAGGANSGVKINNSTGNYIEGNRIGIATDESSCANDYGINLDGNAAYNHIINNVISGNVNQGIYTSFTGNNSNEVFGNYIGTTSDGLSARPNGNSGIYIVSGATSNRIGGSGAGQGNIISGNGAHGIYIEASSNEVLGNYIGLGSDGTSIISNESDGIRLSDSPFNKIGDGTAGGRNTISGNKGNGITLFDNQSAYNEILGNYIGTDYTGGGARGNLQNGIFIDGTGYNTIGNGSVAGRNIISGNAGNGIQISGTSSISNEVAGNYIGTDMNGTADLGNANHGVYCDSGAKLNRVGANNVIAFNDMDGVNIDGASTTHEVITQNSIFSNSGKGIELINGGNSEVAPPQIDSADHSEATGFTLVSGTATAEPDGIIEIFKAEDNEGKIYLGSTNAVSGSWSTNVSGLVSGDAVVATGTTANPQTSEFSQTKEVITTVFKEYQPDNSIATLDSYADITGEGIVNTDGTNQTRTMTITTGASAIYYIKIENDANTTDEVIVKGVGGSGDWTFTYYDAKTGGNNITSSIIGSGWSTGIMAPSESKEIRLVAANGGADASTIEALVTSESNADSNFKDAVKAVTTALPPPTDLTSFAISGATTAVQGTPFNLLITARNSLGSIETNVIGATQLLVDQGTITPESIAESGFVNGVWTGNLTLSKIGARAITASNEGATGTYQIIITNATIEITSGGVTITIPAGASSQEVNISVTEVTDPPGNPPPGYYIAGKIFNINSTPTDYLLPVTVTIPISGALADPRVYYWTGTEWSRDGITIIDITTTHITFTTTHLSIFAPMAASSNNLIRFGPNPYNPDSGTPAKIWYWLDADANTSIYVVDMAGTLVWKKSFDATTNGGRSGSNDVDFDGKDRWGNVLGNGVYIYKIVQNGKAVGGGKIAIIK